jgi:hypothetical protein
MAGQVWEENTAGGYMYSGELSTVLRNALQPQTRFVQHCDAEDFTDKGLHVGANFQWNVYGNVATQGGRLDERAPMPETSFEIAQRSGVIYEFGNSVPYTGVLDDRSAHPVRQIINKALKNDAVKTFEAEARGQFFLSPLCVVPASGNSATAIELTTNGTPGQTNNLAMNTTHIKLISDVMKERNIPVYEDGNYRCMGRPSTFRGVKNTLETLAQYTERGYGYILNGEIGRSYEGIRFFEQTVIASQGWANNLSDEAYFFGADTVIEGIVVPPEMRGKLPGDFGRDKGVAWYAQEGFALAHNVAADARILRWSSLT